MKNFIIAPSILSANFAKLGEEVESVLKAGANAIHIDVMDNHYVPNLTVGPIVCKGLRDYGITAMLDVHLMIKPVDNIIPAFAKAGADCITIHPEATEHIDRTLQLIHNQGCQAGLAFNPATPLNFSDYVLDKLDLILIMTVNPGFGGQQFIPAMIDKIKAARKLIDQSGRTIRLAVDGGINAETILDAAQAGADFFVMGSAIFGQKDYQKAILNLREQLKKL